METPASLPAPVPARRPGRRTVALWLVLTLMLLSGGLASLVVSAGAADEPSSFDFTWSIGDRYGLDSDADGIVDNPDGLKDLAKDKAWIQDPTYTLSFDTCASPAVVARGSASTTYTLTLRQGGEVSVSYAARPP